MLPNRSEPLVLESDQHTVELSLPEVFRIIFDHLWLVLTVCAASVGIGYYIIKTTPAAYKSKVVLLAEFKKGPGLIDKITAIEGQQISGNYDILNTIAAGVTRGEVLERVANKIVNDKEVQDWSTNKLSVEDVVYILRNDRIESRPRRQTRFIDIEMVDENPAYAQKVAQLVAQEYMDLEMERLQGSGSGATNFLAKEAEQLRGQLEQSENRLAQFIRTNRVSIVKDGKDLANSELRELNSQMLVAKAERLKLETDLEAINESGQDVSRLLTIQSILKLDQVAELRTKLLENESEMVNLEQRYKEKHPKMIEAKKLIRTLENKLAQEVLMAPKAVQIELNKAKQKELQMDLIAKEGERRMTERNVATMELEKLQKARDADYELLNATVRRIRQVVMDQRDKTREDAVHDVSIFEQASYPEFPFRPRKMLIAAASLAMGMLLSFGVVYLLHLLDTTVKSVDQAEGMFGVPVLGSVPRSAEVKGDDERLILAADPNSLCSEAFRTLRAAISLLGREDERKVTLFTSAVPSEGKTFCSSNFALATANQGRKTLIVDFDLRRPSVGKTFRIDEDHIGVSDCLLGKSTIEEAAIRTEYDNLDVMTAGTIVPNPSELISSRHTPEFIEAARAKYDQVVIDNAPVTAVSDTLLILNYVDTVCLVSRAAKTSYRLIGRAMKLIRRGGVNPSGLVLNFVPQKGRSGYYYYYHSDKSYYGGYGQSKKKSKRSSY